MCAGISPVSTRRRCQGIASGKSRASPVPLGSEMLRSPTRNSVCDHEPRNPPSRAGPPVLRPPAVEAIRNHLGLRGFEQRVEVVADRQVLEDVRFDGRSD